MQEWNPSAPHDPHGANQQEAQSKQKQAKAAWLEWWYRLTTPGETAKPQRRAEREKARRVRLSSTLLLLITVIWFAAIPVFLLTVSSDPTTIPITCAGLAVIAL